MGDSYVLGTRSVCTIENSFNKVRGKLSLVTHQFRKDKSSTGVVTMRVADSETPPEVRCPRTIDNITDLQSPETAMTIDQPTSGYSVYPWTTKGKNATPSYIWVKMD